MNAEAVLSTSIGAFARLRLAVELLTSVDTVIYDKFVVFIRDQLTIVESLQYFVMDMKSAVLYKHGSHSHRQVFRCDDTGTEAARWVLIQLAFAIVAGNETTFILSDSVLDFFLELLTSVPLPSSVGSKLTLVSITKHDMSGGNLYEYNYSAGNILHNSDGRIIFASLNPPFLSLLRRDVKDITYLQSMYGVSELTDEFDLLPDELRESFVSERTQYLLYELRQHTPYYRHIIEEEGMSVLPIMNGNALSSNVPPYGQSLIAENDNYTVSFASGGTTGRMKYVYRNDWEDKENARYLAKGLYAQGVRSSDVVLNCLSGGFWGGSHVFSLALSFIGCSVVPLGMEFVNADCVQFIQHMKPSTILALPSFIVTLADYVGTLKATGDTDIPSLNKCISGGEMMLPAMRFRIETSLGITQFLSTGYTSNETGAIGFPCRFLPLNHFHIHENMTTVSIIKHDDTAPQVTERVYKDGTIGKIITSNLNRTYMAVVQYDIGDAGRLVRYPFYKHDFDLVGSTRNSTQQNEEGVGSRCLCGRRLSLLELCGRWDDRVRLGGEDLYLEEFDKAISEIPQLSVLYALHIELSQRCFDALEVHIECSDDVYDRIKREPMFEKQLSATFVMQIGLHTSLVWEPYNIYTDTEVLASCGVDSNSLLTHYASTMGEKTEFAMAALDGPPRVVFFRAGTLPRNKRTGKITKIIDHRR